VAFVFAALHPQGWTAIPVLMSIAVVLGILREWRGSSIASMTAHALNNAAVTLVFALVAG
jgi:membrane protease YdiL (CAAX protease family)